MDQELSEEFEGPSKSQLKRDAHKLQALGTRLTTCSEEQLRTLSLPEKTIIAITDFKRLPNSHGARRRQLQFIGKLMRDFDYAQLSTALDRLENANTHKPKPKSVAQSLADDILHNGDAAINQIVAAYSQAERQKLRQFYREYQSANDDSRTRLLDKLQMYLRSLLNE